MSILILGYGKTGRAVDDYLSDSCAAEDVLIYDDVLPGVPVPAVDAAPSASCRDGKNRFFFNKTDEETLFGKYLGGVSRCIVSPGIERGHKVISRLRRSGIPVLSEIEFAYEELMKKRKDKKSRIIAITGTNGKTTAATLCESAAAVAGLSGKTFTGGNLGVPFITGAGNGKFEDFILEISSFQLEWIYDFKPDIAVLLNVRDDHLDRYENFDEYRLTKYKLFKNQGYSDFAVLNYGDYNSAILKGVIGSRAVLFGFDEKKCDVYFKDDAINFKLKDITGSDDVISLENMRDKRKFVIEDMMAAACSLILSGVPTAAVREAFENYRLLSHRVEYVGSIGDIEFYDDSKATNPAAVISALESLRFSDSAGSVGKRDIVLILGGKDKGLDYESLALPVRENVRACVLIGETKEIIAGVLNGHAELLFAGDMDEAVKKSFDFLSGGLAGKGVGTILLSPASSSFDMFKDYGERGDIFKRCYARLKGTSEHD